MVELSNYLNFSPKPGCNTFLFRGSRLVQQAESIIECNNITVQSDLFDKSSEPSFVRVGNRYYQSSGPYGIIICVISDNKVTDCVSVCNPLAKNTQYLIRPEILVAETKHLLNSSFTDECLKFVNVPKYDYYRQYDFILNYLKYPPGILLSALDYYCECGNYLAYAYYALLYFEGACVEKDLEKSDLFVDRAVDNFDLIAGFTALLDILTKIKTQKASDAL